MAYQSPVYLDIPDIGSLVRVHDLPENSAYNGHFGVVRWHPTPEEVERAKAEADDPEQNPEGYPYT